MNFKLSLRFGSQEVALGLTNCLLCAVLKSSSLLLGTSLLQLHAIKLWDIPIAIAISYYTSSKMHGSYMCMYSYVARRHSYS